MELDEETEPWVRKTLDLLQRNEAPLTIDVALEASSLRLPRADPADHSLTASAKVFGLALVTADQRLIELSDVSVPPNR